MLMNKKPINIVVVVCHDLGQYLGCYGFSDARTPRIDRFAREGMLFRKSFCVAPQCSPARAALWTGRYPHANGVVGLAHYWFENDLKPDEVHFSQLAQEAGYETHLFGVQHETPHPEKRLGYETLHPVQGAVAMADAFAGMLAGRTGSERPLFVQFGTFEPHRPFPHEGVEALPPEGMTIPSPLPDIPVVREDLSAFEASTAAVDLAFGKMLEPIDRSPIADNTLVIFTADHGMPFNRCKMSLYDRGLEVPLILRGPGLPSGVIDERHLISHVDVLPTLLDLMGRPQPDNLHGRSFAPLLRGEAYEPNSSVFGEMTYHTYYDPRRCIRTERWKLIANFECAPEQMSSPDLQQNGKGYAEMCLAMGQDGYHRPFELYDLEADPHEQINLADETAYQAVRDGLIRHLHGWMERTEDPLLKGPVAQGAYWKRMKTFKELAS